MERIVIIPALNPDGGLQDLVERNWELENQVILVDDGSSEEYAALFWKLSEKCIVLHHRENRGKGAAIKTALKYVKEELPECSVIGIMDADGQHLPDDMEKLLMKAAAEPSALIIGSRTIDRDVPWKSRVGNLITRRVFRLTTGASVSDTQTGLRAFSSGLIDFMLNIPGERYEYEMNVLVRCAKQGIPIIEVPIQTIYHDKGNSCSHFRKVRDSVRIYSRLLKFCAASFFSFIFDYGLFVLFTLFLPKAAAGVMAANVGARFLSSGYNYMLNCRAVFQKKPSVKTAADYAALAVCILLLNNILLQVFLSGFRIPVYLSKLLTEGTLFFVSWFIQKKLIFCTEKKYYILGNRKSGEWI